MSKRNNKSAYVQFLHFCRVLEYELGVVPQRIMGCCQSQMKGKGGIEDRRRVMDHFMPPGSSQQPRFTYRLEKA